jgi:hypothetical protein
VCTVCSRNGEGRRWDRDPTHVFAEDEMKMLTRGHVRWRLCVVHYRFIFLCFKALARSSRIANMGIHVEFSTVSLTLRVMQGRVLPQGTCIPESPEVKDTGFEIDMACDMNSIIFGKLVTALPGFRAVA